MLNVKPHLIAGIFSSLALFGLLGCSETSKNDEGKLGQQSTPPTEVETYIDPTATFNPRVDVDFNENQVGLSGPRRPIFTGFKYDNNLRYTDSGFDTQNKNDTIMEQIKEDIQSRFDGEDLEKQKDFARSLRIAQVQLNPVEPSEVRITFFMKRDKKEVKYVMTGTIGTFQRRQGRIEERVSVLESVSGPRDMAVRLRCMDRSVTCHASVLTFSQDDGERVAHAVSRSHAADVEYTSRLNDFLRDEMSEFMLVDTQSTGAEKLDLILNNSTRTGGARRRPNLQTVVVESSAIAFGESHFALIARVNNQDEDDTVFSFFGPMVRTSESQTVDLDLGNFTEHLVLKNASEYDPVMKKVSRVSLLENDGRGRFQLELSFGAGQQSETVVLTIVRKFQELRALRD